MLHIYVTVTALILCGYSLFSQKYLVPEYLVPDLVPDANVFFFYLVSTPANFLIMRAGFLTMLYFMAFFVFHFSKKRNAALQHHTHHLTYFNLLNFIFWRPASAPLCDMNVLLCNCSLLCLSGEMQRAAQQSGDL